MSYKTILVHADASPGSYERIRLAANMANSWDAHLVGVAATGISGLFYLPGAVGEGTVQLGEFLDYLEEEAKLALEVFDGVVRKAEVASSEKRLTQEEAGTGISMQARYSDLVVLGQRAPDESSPVLMAGFPEYVVMNSGRPVLIVPHSGKFDRIGRKIVIGWDGSKEATLAIAAAMPFLEHAETVQILVINADTDSWTHGDEPGADIALYLARHQIKVEVVRRSTTSALSHGSKASDHDIAGALLSHVADSGADMLVMGCYAHSRFREVLLDGVTRTILRSMTVLTLMAH